MKEDGKSQQGFFAGSMVPQPGSPEGAGDVQQGAEAVLRDGSRVFVRPLHADDTELERRFIEALSPSSRRFRFLESMRSPSDALLKQMTVIDPATDAAYVALIDVGHEQREIGVARFSARPDGHDCEFAVTVSDEWQNKGLGSLLMERLIAVARARGIEAMHSSDASDNTRMRQFAEHLHFQHKRDPDDATLVLYSVDLKVAGAPNLPHSAKPHHLAAGPVDRVPPKGSTRQSVPTEPAEVLGRHKNSGQKDHKGAR